MNKKYIFIVALLLIAMANTGPRAQNADFSTNLYDIPPRALIDLPTAGTFPRGYFDIGVRLFPNGGAIGNTSIGLSSRLTLGISYGGEDIVSNTDPNWNPRIEFQVKFRIIDELEYFPAVTAGFSSQGYGAWLPEYDRYTFKSRGFYLVVSRSFYFYDWTAGWHAGANYSMEKDFDADEDFNFFVGLDATFKYNLALLMEYDVALNDDRSTLPSGDPNLRGGKGRGYLNLGVKWLFSKNLELEFHVKDILGNRRDADTITREISITYIDKF